MLAELETFYILAVAGSTAVACRALLQAIGFDLKNIDCICGDVIKRVC
jgi:hypothetical protein